MNVEEFHQQNWSGVLVVTGGGTQLLSTLTGVPGASQTLLNAGIPYSQEALVNYLGIRPAQFCSELTARQLAMAAFTEACGYSTDSQKFGFAISASLTSDRPKRGEKRAYVALQTEQRTQVSKLNFEGCESRRVQEQRLSEVAYQQLCWGLGLTEDSCAGVETQWAEAREHHHQLMSSTPTLLGASSNAILPGSFDPLHDGHRRMRNLAESILGGSVQYELSIKNVDKPTLDYLEVDKRVVQFEAGELILSNLPTFFQKATYLSPRDADPMTFVVGIDTLTRIVDPRYAENLGGLAALVDHFRQLKVRFLVFGRRVEGRFLGVHEIDLPVEFKAMCEGVSESQFRDDITSTELRANSNTR